MYSLKIKKQNNSNSNSKYNKYRNFINVVIKKTKSIYCQNKIYDNRGNLKNLWEIIEYATNSTQLLNNLIFLWVGLLGRFL